MHHAQLGLEFTFLVRRALRYRAQVTDKSEIDFGSTATEYFPSFSFRAYSAQPHHCTDARKQSVGMREHTRRMNVRIFIYEIMYGIYHA